MIRWLAGAVLLVGLLLGALFVVAGRGAPPAIAIERPRQFVGQSTPLEVAVDAPGGRLTALTIALEQNGRTLPLFALDTPGAAEVTQPAPDRVRVSRPIGKQPLPDLQPGPARVLVSASRRSFLGLRTLTAEAAHDVEVRLEPPRTAVLSTHHYVNLGGSELVVYRTTPASARSGVRVGDTEYPGYPLPGAAAGDAGSTVYGAFFALRHDQDLETPIVVFARDEADNEATARFVESVFPKRFVQSRIEIDDRFLQRVVPEILERSPGLAEADAADLVPAFLAINRALRQKNGDDILALAAQTAPARLWNGPFVQLGNSQVEARFADHRTYFYKGREIDRQVHLGFDLAVTAAVPVVAANSGRVQHAGWLGIYGNCVVLDHGMGVASLYGHLSSIDVKAGEDVGKGQPLGRSGMTGLAGGDHLHFTMLVGGYPVNPVEWWDPHWITDRVERKLQAAGALPAPTASRR